MNNIQDWVSLVVLGFNVAMFLVIKFNDMHHMGQDIKCIKECLSKISDKQDKDGERIAKIEGKCSAQHGN